MTNRKLDLTICRPTGWHLESPRVSPFMLRLGWYMGRHEPMVPIHDANQSDSRILMIHNWSVEQARRNGSSHILFLDPDMDPHSLWWEWAWKFSQLHPGSVLAAPYCGGGADHPVQVFIQSGELMPMRINRGYAAGLAGVWEVEAIGTGLMLVDMTVFDRLDHQRGPNGETIPYFNDVFTDEKKVEKSGTQDGFFCARVRLAGIPIYCNFDLWSEHQQFEMVGRPRQHPVSEGLPGGLDSSAIGVCFPDAGQSVVCVGTDTGCSQGTGFVEGEGRGR
jgi:hypothetical protein